MNTITKINLSNLKNCKQVWTDMPKNEKGRLCLKCSNTIIDFRNLSDSEIAETHLFSEKKVCGLYKKEQLRKPSKKAETFKLNYWNSFYIGFFSFLSLNSFGQSNAEPTKIEQTEKTYDSIHNKIQRENIQMNPIISDSFIISGKLTDENNEPLPFANVIIDGTRVGTSSDFEGFYRLDIAKELETLNKITLSYSYIGYETIEKVIDSKLMEEGNNRTINIQFIEGEQISVFMVYARAPFHKRLWYRIKSIFRKK